MFSGIAALPVPERLHVMPVSPKAGNQQRAERSGRDKKLTHRGCPDDLRRPTPQINHYQGKEYFIWTKRF